MYLKWLPFASPIFEHQRGHAYLAQTFSRGRLYEHPTRTVLSMQQPFPSSTNHCGTWEINGPWTRLRLVSLSTYHSLPIIYLNSGACYYKPNVTCGTTRAILASLRLTITYRGWCFSPRPRAVNQVPGSFEVDACFARLKQTNGFCHPFPRAQYMFPYVLLNPCHHLRVAEFIAVTFG